jgi:hypothetical protein
MPDLTLHHGGNERTFAAHPTAEARRWLLAAAEVETPEWSALLLRVASALPHRGPIAKGGE